MENKPKFMAYVIGLAKIGVTVALINYHLRQEVCDSGAILIITVFWQNMAI
jgi:hypothetical protein